MEVVEAKQSSGSGPQAYLAFLKERRQSWGPGPWVDEPDRLDWVHRGYACLALRGSSGVWCGYVGVPPGHLIHGFGHADMWGVLVAHGGLTWSSPGDDELGGDPRTWWYGFDCGHGSDIVPRLESWRRSLGPPRLQVVDAFTPLYRDLTYVRVEIESLAEQISELTSKPVLRRDQQSGIYAMALSSRRDPRPLPAVSHLTRKAQRRVRVAINRARRRYDVLDHEKVRFRTFLLGYGLRDAGPKGRYVRRWARAWRNPWIPTRS